MAHLHEQRFPVSLSSRQVLEHTCLGSSNISLVERLRHGTAQYRVSFARRHRLNELPAPAGADGTGKRRPSALHAIPNEPECQARPNIVKRLTGERGRGAHQC